MVSVNSLVRDTATPPIPAAQVWISRYNGQFGVPVDLCQAVPGYPPHPSMLEHLADAAGSTVAAGYGDITGDADLRTVYADHVSRFYSGKVDEEQVAITAGCNQAFFAAMITLAGTGDAVVLPCPWYFNHKMTLDMLGIETRPLACLAEDGFVPDPERVAAAIDGKVRAVVLVSPNNPTGAIYPPEVIERIYRICREKGIWLVLDETYRDFLSTDGTRPHDLLRDTDWPHTLVQLYSFSKSFCIPGHRLGAVVAGHPFIEQFSKVIDCLQICAPRAGQRALVWAIDALADWRAGNRLEISARADAFKSFCNALTDWRLDAIGAYFAYLRHPFSDHTAEEVAEMLAAKQGILCLPGSFFGTGQEQHLRVAFANTDASAIHSLASRFRNFSF